MALSLFSRIGRLGLLLAAPFVLSACGGIIPLKRSDYASIHAVTVAKRSDYPDSDKTMVFTFKQNMAGALGGVIGAVAVSGIASDERLALRQHLIDNKIDPGLLVANEFEQQLRGSGLFPSIKSPGDAEFKFEIQSIGLCIPHGFATRLNPVLRVNAQLVRRRDGQVIWKDVGDVVGEDSDYGGHALDEYMSQPELLRNAFAGSARTIASRLIEDLKRDLK